MLDVAIEGGLVVIPDGPMNADIGIQGERIVLVAAPGNLPSAHTMVSASGKIVTPGGIDPHVHCNLSVESPEGGEPAVSAGSDVVGRAAVCGGTTTIIDFIWVEPGESLTASIERQNRVWKGNCPCDYSFHLVLRGEIADVSLAEVPEVITGGFPSFKIFITNVFPHAPIGGVPLKADFGSVRDLFDLTVKHGALTVVHAEDDDLVMHMYRRLARENRMSYVNMAEVHSSLSEDLSFRRVIRLAELTGSAPIYFMHTSAATGVDAIAEARSRGLAVYGETLHQYALRTVDNYREPDGMKYHTYPSLKTAADTARLWSGVGSKDISTFATDEQCTPYQVKVAGKRVDDVVGGNAGIEPRMAIVYTEVVSKRNLGLQRFTEVTSTNAAKLFGMFPKKGAIAVGSDADLCVLDPNDKRNIVASELHESDYTPWEGWQVDAWPVLTLVRGKVVYQDGQFKGDVRDGQLVFRKLSSSIGNGSRFV